ncbi:MAG: cytochrome c [Nitrospira defluvii]|nr:cytochrome c [Nitrospira defluvii]
MRTFTGTGTRMYCLASALVTAMAAACGHAAAQDFPADVTRGKAVYERHCLACHGTSGWGDGPDAAALRVPPTNFHRFTSILKSDEELLRTIEHGVVFSPMHSWQGILTETEMQDALAYIRLLEQQGR